MSTPSVSIVKKSKAAEFNQVEKIVEKSKNRVDDKKIPALRSNVDSEEKALEKKVWTNQHTSSFDGTSEADNAESDHSNDDIETNFSLLDESEYTHSKHQSPTRDSYTTTANTTTTTTTTTTTATPNIDAAQLANTTEADKCTEDQVVWITKNPYPTISLSPDDLDAKLDLINFFLERPEAKKLVMSLPDDGDLNKAISAFTAISRNKFSSVVNKEVFISLDHRVTDPSAFHALLNTIYKSSLVTGLDFVGDGMLKKWSDFKRVLGTTSKVDTFQFSGVTSDAFCECFKSWLPHKNVIAIDKPPMLRAKTLCFVDLKISDAAVFGSVLGALILKMPKLSLIDFSGANLSDEQKDVLRFQLGAIAVDREHLLKF
jgi:hypothetical protein